MSQENVEVVAPVYRRARRAGLERRSDSRIPEVECAARVPSARSPGRLPTRPRRGARVRVETSRTRLEIGSAES